jgi:hypothetical protein
MATLPGPVPSVAHDDLFVLAQMLVPTTGAGLTMSMTCQL